MNVMGCNKANNNVKRDYFKSRKNCEKSFWRRMSWRGNFFDSSPYSENFVQQNWNRWLLRTSYQISIWCTKVSSWIAKIILSQRILYPKINILPFYTLFQFHWVHMPLFHQTDNDSCGTVLILAFHKGQILAFHEDYFSRLKYFWFFSRGSIFANSRL